MPTANKNAKRSGSTKTLVLALPHFTDIFSSYYSIEVMKGVSNAAENSSYDLQLHMFSPSMEEEELKEHLLAVANLKGVLFADIDGNRKIISMLKKNKIPYVIMNNLFDDNETNCIGIDNISAAEEAVEYLIKLGHTDIATITGNLKTQSGMMRLSGYKAALVKHKIKENPEYIVNGAYNKEKAQEGMVRLINEKPKPTAVFAASDLMAFGAIMVALREDISVPEDISIVGFDNSPIAALGYIAITTVNQPLAEMGEIAVRGIIDIIEGKIKQPFNKILRTTMIMGNSCRKLS